MIELFKLLGTIAVDNEEANKNIDETSEKASGLGTKLASSAKTVAKFGVGVAAASAGAAIAIGKVATSSAATADNIDKMSQKIGISREAYQEFDFICSQSGTSVDQLQTGLKTLTESMAKAASGTDENVAMFEQLGVSVTDSEGNLRSQEDVMMDTLSALQKMKNQTEKARLATKLFGRAGTELMPMLNGAEGSIEAMKEQAHELGLILSDEAVDSCVQLTDTMDQMKRSLAAVGTNLGAAVMPIVQQFAQLIIDNLPIIQSMFAQISPLLTGLMTTLLPPLMQLVSQVLPVIMEILAALMPTAMQIVEMVLPIMLDLLTTLLPPLLQIVQSILPVVNTLLAAAMPILQILLDILKPILDLFIALLVPIIDIISKALQPLIEIIGMLISAALQPLSNHIKFVADIFGTYLKSMLENASNIIEKITGVFRGIATFLKGVFTGDFKIAFQGLGDIVKNYFGAIVEFVKLPLNTMISMMNTFISGLNKIQIPDWVPSVGGKGLNIPMIPKLENGGVLAKGQVGFLEGNGAEAVVPLENNAKWIRSVSQDMAAQGIGASIDYGKLSESIVNALRDVMPELNQTVQVVPDESGIFRIVRDSAREFTNKTGRSAFA